MKRGMEGRAEKANNGCLAMAMKGPDRRAPREDLVESCCLTNHVAAGGYGRVTWQAPKFGELKFGPQAAEY